MISNNRDHLSGNKNLKRLNFSTTHEQFKDLYESMVKNLKEQSNTGRVFTILAGLLITSSQTYKSICFLVANGNRNKYPAQAHILVRSIIDALFSTVYLLENPAENSRRFELNGLRYLKGEYDSLSKKYSNEKSMKEYLDEKDKFIQRYENDLNLNNEEEGKLPKSFWPTPHQMLHSASINQENKSFLQEIYDLEYIPYSEGSHLAWGGTGMGIFADNPQSHELPGKFESDAVYKAMLFLLMILTELESSFKVCFSKKIKKLWKHLGSAYEEALDYYKNRYREKLK